MTNLDVMAHALAHATGKPTAFWSDRLQEIAAILPGHKFYEPCPNAVATLETLKAEAPGILAWLIQGAKNAHSTQEK